MSSGHEFNYRVALASGMRGLQGGRLRHAQEEFGYLIRTFPRRGEGYRGLAMVQAGLGDRAAALETLRGGASALARAGERPAEIALLREAVRLAPRDLPAHRRLGAALALAGDTKGAALEYRRFIEGAVAAGDLERAGLEARYAVHVLAESRDAADLLLGAIAAAIGGRDARVLLDEVAARSAGGDAARRESAPAAYEVPPEGKAPLAEGLDRLSRRV